MHQPPVSTARLPFSDLGYFQTTCLHILSFSRTEAYSEEEEEGRRATKRRKLGIAETLLSTVISVAIVSTAVGYTAYKL